MTTRAQNCHGKPVSWIVGEVGHVQQAVSLTATLADIAGGFEDCEPELPPARVVIFAVLRSDRHGINQDSTPHGACVMLFQLNG